MAEEKKSKSLKYLFKGDPHIWAIYLLLCLVSLIEVYSSSSFFVASQGNFWGATLKHAFMLFWGGVAVLFLLNIPCRFFKIASPLLYILSLFLLVVVLFFGHTENGAARWIGFGPVAIQPSEIAKATLVLVTAHILSEGQTPEGVSKNALIGVAIAAFFLIILVIPENLSTAALMVATVLLMLVVARVRWKNLLKILGTMSVMALLGISFILLCGKTDEELNEERMKARVEVVEDKDEIVEVKKDDLDNEVQRLSGRVGFLHRIDTWKSRIMKFGKDDEVPPKDYDLDKNGQVGHANIAIASSNILGVGPGNSVQRDFLPQAFSDFIYAIIFEEFGLWGAFVVACLYVFLLFRTGTIARRCVNSFPAFLIMGYALMIVMQALFNMLVAVGIAPVTGQPLPLISKGGTSTIITSAYIGIILSVSRTAKKRIDMVEDDEVMNIK